MRTNSYACCFEKSRDCLMLKVIRQSYKFLLFVMCFTALQKVMLSHLSKCFGAKPNSCFISSYKF